MKKIIFILCSSLLLLCACSKRKASDNLEFIHTNWGMTMEETMKAYHVTKEDTTRYTEGQLFTIVGKDLFGEKTAEINFRFIDLKAGTPKLCNVLVTYPEDADMEAVLRQMQKEYGETVSQIFRYSLFEVIQDKISVYTYQESEHIKLWADQSVQQSIPEAQQENYCLSWEKYQTGLNKDNWETFAQEAKLVTIAWSDEQANFSVSKNALEFDGYNLIVSQEIAKQLAK